MVKVNWSRQLLASILSLGKPWQVGSPLVFFCLSAVICVTAV
jgi:hypothetical protein